MTGSNLRNDEVVRLLTNELKSFVESYTVPSEQPLQPFSWDLASCKNHSTKPKDCRDTDIHPDFITRLVCIAEAFGVLERPDTAYYKLASNASSLLQEAVRNKFNTRGVFDFSCGEIIFNLPINSEYNYYKLFLCNIDLKNTQGKSLMYKLFSCATMMSENSTEFVENVSQLLYNCGGINDFLFDIVKNAQLTGEGNIVEADGINAIHKSIKSYAREFSNKLYNESNSDKEVAFLVTKLTQNLKNNYNKENGELNFENTVKSTFMNDKYNKLALHVESLNNANTNELNEAAISDILVEMKSLQKNSYPNRETFVLFLLVSTLISLKEKNKNVKLNPSTFDDTLKKMCEKAPLLYNRLQSIQTSIDSGNVVAYLTSGIRLVTTPQNHTKVDKTPSLQLSKQVFNVVKDDCTFFSNYYNVIDENGIASALNTSSGNILDNGGRLNVLKSVDLRGGLKAMAGGGDTQDIKFITQLPSGSDTIEIYIISLKINVQKSNLKNEIIKIFHGVSTGSNEQFYNKSFDGIHDYYRTTRNSVINSSMNEKVKNLFLLSDNYELTDEFFELESQLKKSAVKSTNNWIRSENQFINREFDNKGEYVDKNNINDCEFFPGDHNTCMNFFEKCLVNNDNVWDDQCSFLFKDGLKGFETNQTPKDIVERVVNLNPAMALKMLKKFQFASFTSEQIKYPHLNRTKVQSVKQWISDMTGDDFKLFGNSQNDIKNLVTGAGLTKLSGSDRTSAVSQRRGFLQYLAILVDWVNANPQVLNPEEGDLHTVIQRDYPEENKSYRMYRYISPQVRSDRLNLYNLSRDLMQLKYSVLNGTAGFNDVKLSSDIVGMPANIYSPFGHYAYNNALPSSSISLTARMSGGELRDISEYLSGPKRAFGYEVLNDIFTSLQNTFQSTASPRRSDLQVRLKKDSEDRLKGKLDELKKLELELLKGFNDMGIKYRLYRASDGKINPNNIRDGDLPALLKKHSNLMNLTQVYNKKAVTLLDLFKIIADVIKDKYKDEDSIKYTRPMTTNY